MPSVVASKVLSKPPRERPRSTAILLLFLSSLQRVHSQTWETSNDPDHLCTTTSGVKFTGYKATRDCRGYVYCNDGYLMGGGIIPCWPNQLFDEIAAICTNWQSVDTSRCPDFDGSMMMPDQQDENANPERFFVSDVIRHRTELEFPSLFLITISFLLRLLFTSCPPYTVWSELFQRQTSMRTLSWRIAARMLRSHTQLLCRSYWLSKHTGVFQSSTAIFAVTRDTAVTRDNE